MIEARQMHCLRINAGLSVKNGASSYLVSRLERRARGELRDVPLRTGSADRTVPKGVIMGAEPCPAAQLLNWFSLAILVRSRELWAPGKQRLLKAFGR